MTQLDQFFTPIEIADFMYSILSLDNDKKVIDCAAGDGILLRNFKHTTFWDIEARPLVSSFVRVIDSILHFDVDNERYDIAVSNPPFSKSNKWDKDENIMNNYEMGHQWKFCSKTNQWLKTDKLINAQLGILFIERNLQLVKDGGIVQIILPNGYLTNPSYAYIREFILKKSRIIGIITLPDNLFKRSGAGGLTVLLILRKEKNIIENYNIFTAIVNKLGFDHVSKRLTPMFVREHETGNYLLDKNGNKIPDNDLVIILKEFGSFIAKNNIIGFKRVETNVSYNFTTRNEVMKNRKNLIICPKRSSVEYRELISTIEGKPYFKLLPDEISNKKDIIIEEQQEYIYLNISEVFMDNYKVSNKLMGWELPNRARIDVKENDILIAKLAGSADKFTMIYKEQKNLIASNGFFRIRIRDEMRRLSFYNYLFNEDYILQIKSLATGSIMADIKEEDLINELKIPIYPEEKILRLKKLIEIKRVLFDF